MLRIKTFIRNSRIEDAGLGLFTSEDLKQGDLIYFFDHGLELVFPTINNLLAHDTRKVTYFSKYGYSHNGQIRVPIDEGKYMNHSIEPNCSDNGNSCFAARDILAGEELTCDYALLGNAEEDKEFNLFDL